MKFKFSRASELTDSVDLYDILPYGMFTTADGSEVLFDRHYRPMYARDANGENVQRAYGFIEDVVKQSWFYDDDNSLSDSQEAVHRSEKALVAFAIGKSVNDFVYKWSNVA